jgi:hypothetical protein
VIRDDGTLSVRVPALAGALVAAGLLTSSVPGGAWQTIPRLCIAFIVVQILPGWLVLTRSGWFPAAKGVIERGLLSYAISYIVTAGINVAVMLAHLNVTFGITLLLIVIGGLAAVSWRDEVEVPTPSWRKAQRPGWAIEAVALGLVTYLCYCAWRLEPSIEGEEIFELTVLRKIVESHNITLTNLLHRPNASFPYLFTPFYFATGLMTKIAGLPLVTVYIKLRAIYVLAALASFWALGRRFSGSRSFATFAVIGLATLIAIDPDPWSWPASLFPLVRRGGFMAGVLVPLLMLVFHHSVFLDRPSRTWAIAVPSLLLFAMLSTQSMGGVFSLCFAAGLSFAIFAHADWQKYRANCIALALTMGAALLVFVVLHQHFVGHIAEYLQADRIALKGEIADLLKHPAAALFAGVPPGGHYLIVASGAVTVYSIISIALLPVLLLRAPMFARALWLPLAGGIALYSIPLMLAVLQLLTVREAIFAGGYFSLLGIMAYLGVVYLAVPYVDRLWRRVASAPWFVRLAAAAAVAGLAIAVGEYVLLPVSWKLMAWTQRFPSMPLVVGGIGGVLAWLGRRVLRGSAPDEWIPEANHITVTCLAFVGLLVPVYIGMKQFPGALDNSHRAPMWMKLKESQGRPSVTDWRDYYASLQERLSIDIPWEVLEDLRRILPPQKIVLFDPRQSIMIPFLLNEYIVNPGVEYSTDMAYFKDYVRTNEFGRKTHPIYNDSAQLTNQEREFIDQYAIDFVLVNPKYASIVRTKMLAYSERFHLIYERAGFLLYGKTPAPPEHVAGN